MSLKTWPLIRSEEILKTPVFTVHKNYLKSPLDGQEKPFVVMDLPDWVQVLAITEDQQVLLVRQYRQGVGTFSLELPGGVVEVGQNPLEAAKRELMEESGYSAESWTALASFRPNPAIQNNKAHLFVAEKARLTGVTDFDENEDIELQLVSLEQLKTMVSQGTIDHAIMVAGILSYFNSRNIL